MYFISLVFLVLLSTLKARYILKFTFKIRDRMINKITICVGVVVLYLISSSLPVSLYSFVWNVLAKNLTSPSASR